MQHSRRWTFLLSASAANFRGCGTCHPQVTEGPNCRTGFLNGFHDVSVLATGVCAGSEIKDGVWSHVCLKWNPDKIRPLPAHANVTFKIGWNWQCTLRNNWWHSIPCSTFMIPSRSFFQTLQTQDWVCGNKRSRLLETGEAAYGYRHHPVSWYPSWSVVDVELLV